MKGALSRWTTQVTVIPALIILLVNNTAKATDHAACFMKTEDGRTIDLGKLCGIAPVKPADTDTGVYRIPIKRRSGNTPVIDVTFNGNKTFEMIFDTGASGTLIRAC